MNYFYPSQMPASQHAPGFTSLGFRYRTASGDIKTYEARNVRNQEEAYKTMPEFVKKNLIKPLEVFTLPHIP